MKLLVKFNLLLIVVFGLAAFLAWKLLSDKPVRNQPHEDQPLKISKNSPAFNNAFDSLLTQYFAVRDALVDWDTLRADRAAYILAAFRLARSGQTAVSS